MSLLSIALALHALAAVVWVGGMAFAYVFLRPVATSALEGPARLDLWRGVFARFFPVVWVCVALLLVTGYHMTFTAFGGFAQAGMYIHVMHGLGWVMFALFAHLFFAPWKRFRRAVDGVEREQAAKELARIRLTIAINLVLGVIVVLVATGGRYAF
ncbi:MAG: CopD family protein [Halofilum sp. (in: g-proteobacteria)]|nr:CopD family protein [Halofilum sp. (in: g-proteobacteria)]